MGDFVIILPWVLFAFIPAVMGTRRRIGFWPALILSLILSPVIGFIIVLFYPIIPDEILDQKSKGYHSERPAVSTADELVKLKSLKDQGIITEKEFEQQKKKLLL